MKKILLLIFLILPFVIHASPYASNYLYENMLNFLENPEKYSDNITHGYIKNKGSNIIIGAFIEKAYSVYEKEEKYTPNLISCGNGCYKDKKETDILNSYHKFFYMYAIAEEISSVLLQNPQKLENIDYIIRNKNISYKWYKENKLFIKIDANKIEFIKDNTGITIKTNIDSLKKYRLN